MAPPRATRWPTGHRRILIAVAAVAAVGAWMWLRPPAAPPLPDTPPRETTDLERPPRLTVAAETPRQPPAAAKLRALRAMSETYRNTTFLGAIRAAGFVCYALESVYGGVNDSTTWTVACADMLAYTVSVDDAGALVVEPTMQFLDSAPLTAPRDERLLPQPTPRQLLPPQR